MFELTGRTDVKFKAGPARSKTDNELREEFGSFSHLSERAL